MKKFYFCLALACILPLFCGCQKEKEDTPETPEVKPLKLQDKAISISFKDESAPFTEIVLTETGKAILSKNPAQKAPATRASIYVPEYIYGTYEVKGDVYTIYDDKDKFVCHLQLIKGTDGLITSTTIYLSSEDQDGVTYAVTTLGKVSESDLTIDLCRNWIIRNTHVTLDGAVKASKVFEGTEEAASFNAILAYAKEKAPQLEAEIPENMAITDVMFTQSGSFIILFKNGKIFVGNWSWKNEQTGELNYSWDGGEKIYEYESGKATFTVESYRRVSYFTLTLSASVQDGGKTYNITIAFNLEEK